MHPHFVHHEFNECIETKYIYTLMQYYVTLDMHETSTFGRNK